MLRKFSSSTNYFSDIGFPYRPVDPTSKHQILAVIRQGTCNVCTSPVQCVPLEDFKKEFPKFKFEIPQKIKFSEGVSRGELEMTTNRDRPALKRLPSEYFVCLGDNVNVHTTFMYPVQFLDFERSAYVATCWFSYSKLSDTLIVYAVYDGRTPYNEQLHARPENIVASFSNPQQGILEPGTYEAILTRDVLGKQEVDNKVNSAVITPGKFAETPNSHEEEEENDEVHVYAPSSPPPVDVDVEVGFDDSVSQFSTQSKRAKYEEEVLKRKQVELENAQLKKLLKTYSEHSLIKASFQMELGYYGKTIYVPVAYDSYRPPTAVRVAQTKV